MGIEMEKVLCVMLMVVSIMANGKMANIMEKVVWILTMVLVFMMANGKMVN